MQAWFTDKKKAKEAARGSGFLLYRMQKLVRVRQGTHWSNERRCVGEPLWYVGPEPKSYFKGSHWEIVEESKDSEKGEGL